MAFSSKYFIVNVSIQFKESSTHFVSAAENSCKRYKFYIKYNVHMNIDVMMTYIFDNYRLRFHRGYKRSQTFKVTITNDFKYRKSKKFY